MFEDSTERIGTENPKPKFFLTGFTQTAGIRVYTFEGRVDARRIDYTVEVDLGLIPGYGILIQELPQLCCELLQHGERDQNSAVVFTEQNMRSHAEELAIRRIELEHRKRQPAGNFRVGRIIFEKTMAFHSP